MQTLSQTQICNLALAHLGIEPIGDISDAVPAANACNQYWIPCRDDVYSEHDWGFNKSQITLSVPANVTVQGWCYAYAYPNNVSGVWTVFNPCDYERKWEIEFDLFYDVGTQLQILASNQPNAICEAGYIISDPTIWSPKFAIAFSRRLAAEIAKALTGDDTVALGQMSIYTALIAEAKRVGFNQQKKKPHQVHGYRDSRQGHGHGHQQFTSLDQAVQETQ